MSAADGRIADVWVDGVDTINEVAVGATVGDTVACGGGCAAVVGVGLGVGACVHGAHS